MAVDVDCRFSAVAQAVISYARPIVIRVPTVRPVVLLFHYTFRTLRSSPESFANLTWLLLLLESLKVSYTVFCLLVLFCLLRCTEYFSSYFMLRASHPYPHLLASSAGQVDFQALSQPEHDTLNAAAPICRSIHNLTVAWNRN